MMILDKAKYTSLLTTNILISLFAIIITFSACSGGNGGGDGDRDGDGGDLVAPTITTGSLPGGAIGIAYNQTLAATGVVPITWSIDSGTLPNGLTLDENGIISGIPNTAGASNFTVKATNNEGSNTKALSLIITLTPVAPIITIDSLPNGTIGTIYNQTLTVTGTAPIIWSIDSGTLPDGLTLAENGTISGTPNTTSTSNFTVKATNIAGSNTKALSLIIILAPVAPIITTDSLPNGTVGTTYNQTLTVTGAAPITWSIDSGTLPDGLTLAENGIISGTPSTVGTSNFTVKATNIAGSTTKSLTITISIDLETSTTGLYLGTPDTIDETQTPKVSGNDIDAAITYVNDNAGTGEYSLLVGEDITVAPNTIRGLNQTNAKLTIIGIGEMRKISMNTSSQGRIFTVGASGKTGISLTLGNNITLVGRNDNNEPVVYVQNGAKLTMKSNAIIRGNTTSGDSSGVYVYGNGSSFTMNDNSSVSGNTAFTFSGGSCSGGVYVYGNGSSFTMNGNSSVSDNTAFSYIINGSGVIVGGGVYVGGVYIYGNGSSFTMNDNASISNNGRGVYVDNSGTFSMNGNSSVSNNDGSGVYAGVYVGVYVDNSGTFSMNDNSSVSNNNGGGVYADNSGTFSMNDNSSVSNNGGTYSRYGGGVYVSDSSFTMNGSSSISNNTSSVYGGGVYVSDSSFTMNGSSSISGNTANSGGGGVYVNSGTFLMNNSSSISGNTANSNGGGMYVSGSGNFFTMNDNSSVSGNTANSGGGVHVSSGIFLMNNSSSISGN
ncbi:MAG: putative Ig domain-containing protein, partial [Leptospirales bacterium]|nr:putative Ig domain-containing protein [Leptospirales bacterium]